MAKKPNPEKAQYPPLGRYLQDLGCEKKNVWMAGQGDNIRLSVNDPHSRTPDVVGAQRSGDGWRTHIIEAKRNVGGAAAIPLGIAQLRAVRAYADFLYLSMEKDDWDARPELGQRTLTAQLAADGIGLLLVKGNAVTPFQAPTANNADTDLRNELLEWLDVDPRSTMRLEEPLGKEHAVTAARTLTFVAQSVWQMRGVLQKAFPKARLPRERDYLELYTESLGAYPYATVDGPAYTEALYAEGDPFGYYMRDGVPAVWVFRPCKPKAGKGAPFAPAGGWFVYAEDGHEDHVAPWTKAAVADLTNRGCTSEWHVGVRIPVVGKTAEEVCEQGRRVVNVIKSAAFKALVN